MKKIFTLCIGLIAAITMQAQSDFPIQFADKDGNIIADGSTLILTEVEDDGFGSIMVPSNLFVKNTTEDELHCFGSFTINSIGSGMFQSCFPANCKSVSAKGSYTTQEGALGAGELKNMLTEWLPTEEGTCEVTYQLVTCKQNVITKKWVKDKMGPVVTLIFNYGVTPGGKGDVNGDGTVDVADISAIITSMASDKQDMKADVNGDGSVDVADISSVLTIMSE